MGKLEFTDGMPSAETVDKMHGNLFTMRATSVFLDDIRVASIEGMTAANADIGVANGNFVITGENVMNVPQLFLTPNTTVVYALSNAVVEDDEPLVIELPSGVLGFIDDASHEFVGDLGLAGQDAGKGGKYLLVSDDYKGDIPDGYFVLTTSTKTNFLGLRAFIDPAKGIDATVDYMQSTLSVYPLSQADNPPAENFTDISGTHWNGIHANDFHYFEEMNTIVQREGAGALDDTLEGSLKSIGIEHGKPFNPTAHEKAMLIEAAKIGNATARTVAYSPRDRDIYKYSD